MSGQKLANRLLNAEKSLQRLEEAVAVPLDDRLMNLDATVHRFNTSFEAMVKAVDVYLTTVRRMSRRERGRSKFELLQSAYGAGLVDDDEAWTRILKARNTTVHEYDLQKALALYREIRSHVPRLRGLLERMKAE